MQIKTNTYIHIFGLLIINLERLFKFKFELNRLILHSIFIYKNKVYKEYECGFPSHAIVKMAIIAFENNIYIVEISWCLWKWAGQVF